MQPMTGPAELLPRQGIAPAKPHVWIPLRHLYSSCSLESLPPGCLAAIVERNTHYLCHAPSLFMPYLPLANA
jgi:hypothetical protein